MSQEDEETPQRWTTKGKAALILSVLNGETSLAEAARKHGLRVAELEGWEDRFLMGAENALRARPRDEQTLKEEQIKKLKQQIGELVVGMNILKEAQKPYLPTTPGTSEE
jgi:transposase-like protein